MGRPRRDTPGLAERRREAIRLVLDDQVKPAEAARRVGCHRSSVLRWVAAAGRGPRVQRGTTKPGRPTRLTGEAQAMLRARLSAPPRRRGLGADEWTTELAIEQLRSVGQYEYTMATGVKILRSLGFRRVRSRPHADGTVVPAYWILPSRTARQ